MTKYYKVLCFLLLLTAVPASANDATDSSVAQDFQPEWYSTDANGDPRIHLYFFWTNTCPHCRQAKPFMPKLTKSYPWLELHQLQLRGNRDNVNLYINMAASLDKVARSVPSFLFCETMMVGYGNEKTTGALLKQKLEACYQQRTQTKPEIPEID